METVSTKGGPRVGTLNWSKVHLVYFALAAFDLLAIVLGLWLSNHTGSKFEESMASVEGAQFVKERASNLMLLSAQLSGPANDIFSDKDAASSMAELQTAYNRFRSFASEESFNRAISELTGHDTKAMGGHGEDAQKVIAAILHVSPDVIDTYEENEDLLRNQAEKVYEFSLSAIKSHQTGNIPEAAAGMQRSDAASREMVGLINKLANAADQDLHRILEDSKKSFSFASMMQYIIGAAIFLMVAMVMTYGHFVGKLLRRKFADLADSEERSAAFNLQLQAMNDDISKLNVDLNDKVQSLKQAQDELIKKGRMEQLGQLTATIAHELRNPLSAVRTSAFLLERKFKDKGLGVEGPLDRINKGIIRCDNIITQLLDFSRTRQLSCQPGDLDKWLSGVVEEEAKKLPAAVNVELTLGLDNQSVPFDPARLQRAVINMISNAVEAMVPFEAKTVAGFVEPKISISTYYEQGQVGVRVIDNGPGIATDVLARIREPLFTTKSFGTGLGVPAIEQIAAQHGGRLDIRSELGVGSVFTIWLPLKPEAAAAETQAA